MTIQVNEFGKEPKLLNADTWQKYLQDEYEPMISLLKRTDTTNKQEIALQYLEDARDWFAMFELFRSYGENSPRRYQSPFISKATVHLIFAMECSLKSIIATSKIEDDSIEGLALLESLIAKSHRVKVLYDDAKSIIGNPQELAAVPKLRLEIKDRYSIVTLAELKEKESIETLQLDKYYFPAQALLKIAEKQYATFATRQLATQVTELETT